MASEYTSHYNLDKYVSSDKPNLRDQYNAAMDKIDAQMYANNGLSSTALNAANDAVKKTNDEIDRAKEAEKAISDSVSTLESSVEKQISDTADSITSGYQAAVATETARAKSAEEELTHIVTGQDTLIANNKADSDAKFAGTADSGLKSLIMRKNFSKMIYIGDSWGQGFYSGANHPTQGLAKYIADSLGCDYVNAAVSGSGFITGTTFETQLNSLTTTEKAGADLVVICGGQNDYSTATITNVREAVISCLTTARNLFPNAEIHVFPLPLSYGRNLGNQDEVSNLDAPKLAYVYEGIKTGVAVSSHSKVFIHDGCHRWGWELGYISVSQYIDDAWHLTSSGYRAVANIMANLCISGGDYWPTMVGNASGYNGEGNIQHNQVIESNGQVSIRISLQATADNPIGTALVLPYWAAPSISTFYANMSTVNGLFLAFDVNKNDGTFVVSIQGTPLTNSGWLFVNVSYNAGF